MADVKKVLMVTPEFYGDTMVGGLAMAVSGLSNSLMQLGMDVAVMMPCYAKSGEAETYTREPFATKGGLVVHETEVNGIKIYKVSGINPGLIEPQKGSVQQKQESVEFDFQYVPDINDSAHTGIYSSHMDKKRFHALLRFANAVPRAMEKANLKPDVIHLHEWTSASASFFLRNLWYPQTNKIPVVLTTHNANYSGTIPDMNETPEDMQNRFAHLNHILGSHISAGNRVFTSLLELGSEYSDFLTTVSPTEAQEILAGREGINPRVLEVFKRKGLEGILNGLDPDVFNPINDELIERFNPQNPDEVSEAKKANKRRFTTLYSEKYKTRRRQVNLDPDKMWITMMCRLTNQKGIYQTVYALRERFGINTAQLLIIGDPLNSDVKAHVESLGRSVFTHTCFAKPELQHLALAASDAILQPSRYEPFGYTQIEGMAYGALPIVTDVGGHHDTIQFYNGDNGYGFKIQDLSTKSINNAINNAEQAYQNQGLWKELIQRAVKEDFTWLGPRGSAKKYLSHYMRLIEAAEKK
ncbi:MAG: glycogen/starch synthase [Nanoarchaeota archaeon]|nr:glycogen/starch synthase [Nanoarchaeota archaeon]